MKTTRPYPSLLIAAAFAALLLLTAMSAPAARADSRETSTIKFSDATKPGTLKVSLAMGDIKITGSDTATEITVLTEMQSDNPAPRKDGMRVLSESATFSLTEKNNTVTLDAGHELSFGGGETSFDITVPSNTCVVISNSFGGEIRVSEVTGDIEVKSLNGEVHLENVTGGALVETMNGEIEANIRSIRDGKPLSFTSMNGEIALHVPVDAKANVRLRTQNGAILTDFDDKALVTKTESVRSKRGKSYSYSVGNGDNAEIRQAVREAVHAGMEAAREAAQAMREAAQAAREAAEEARAEAEADSAAAHAEGSVSPVPPIPPIAPLPPMTGGKLVSGTLNGGGTEIYAAAMNGDVVLRKVE